MKFKTRAIGFKRYQSERNACVQCGFPFFTLIRHTKNIWIPLPWSGKQTVNNGDCSGTKELPQSCTTPYGGPIPFLECVLFFKTKTPDVRLKVAQKRMAQEWKAHIQHWSERAAYRKANTAEKLPPAHVKDSDASSIRNTYFWKLHKSCFIYPFNIHMKNACYSWEGIPGLSHVPSPPPLLCRDKKVLHSLDPQVFRILWEIGNIKGRRKKTKHMCSEVWTHGIPTVYPHLTIGCPLRDGSVEDAGLRKTLISVHWAEDPYSKELKGQRWALLEEKRTVRSKVFFGKVFLRSQQEGRETRCKDTEKPGYSPKMILLRQEGVDTGTWRRK